MLYSKYNVFYMHGPLIFPWYFSRYFSKKRRKFILWIVCVTLFLAHSMAKHYAQLLILEGGAIYGKFRYGH